MKFTLDKLSQLVYLLYDHDYFNGSYRLERKQGHDLILLFARQKENARTLSCSFTFINGGNLLHKNVYNKSSYNASLLRSLLNYIFVIGGD